MLTYGVWSVKIAVTEHEHFSTIRNTQGRGLGGDSYFLRVVDNFLN